MIRLQAVGSDLKTPRKLSFKEIKFHVRALFFLLSPFSIDQLFVGLAESAVLHFSLDPLGDPAAQEADDEDEAFRDAISIVNLLRENLEMWRNEAEENN